MASSTVVIVGAGVIGLSAAYHIARARLGRVVLIDKDHIGAGSSSRAAGITTALLWTETGVRARALGIEWFRRMSEELGAAGYRYHDEHGCLNLFTPQSWPARESLLPLYDRLKIRYEVLNSSEIHRRWPQLQLRDELIGLWDPSGGYSEPDEYVSALSNRVRDLGVQIIEGEEVQDLQLANDRVTGVVTDKQTFHADAVISGVHSWGPAIWPRWGMRFPMKSFVHQRYLSAPQVAPLIAPSVNADPYSGYIRPARGNRVLLGVETSAREEWKVDRSDFKMSNLSVPPDLAALAAIRFEALLPGIAKLAWESESVGLISFSSDGEPILGPVKQIPGLFIAGAFHSGGFSYNTVAGLLLSEMVAGVSTSVDVNAFSPDRFESAATDSYLGQTVMQSDAVRRRH